MHNFGTLFLWALAACTQWHGSLSADLQSGYVCLIDDPNPNQCDNFSLTQLRAQLNQVIKAQDLGNTRDADIQAKLNSVVNQQAKLEGQLQEVLNQLQAVSKNIDAAKVKNSNLVRTSLSGFERIGDRYFLIVHEEVTWANAERRCLEMGGYLASFQNEAEFTAVKSKLKKRRYWLGIHDRSTEGRYISVATQNPPQFLKWFWGQPSDKFHTKNCVLLGAMGEMWDKDCSLSYNFICQVD